MATKFALGAEICRLPACQYPFIQFQSFVATSAYGERNFKLPIKLMAGKWWEDRDVATDIGIPTHWPETGALACDNRCPAQQGVSVGSGYLPGRRTQMTTIQKRWFRSLATAASIWSVPAITPLHQPWKIMTIVKSTAARSIQGCVPTRWAWGGDDTPRGHVSTVHSNNANISSVYYRTVTAVGVATLDYY